MTIDDVDIAVKNARAAAGAWSETPHAQRAATLQSVAAQYEKRKPQLIEAICREVRKPRWEAATEVDAMIAKVSISFEAYERRTSPSQTVSPDGITSATRYKPHGVVAVLGPFNMPGHLPNGHLVPAVLAGNTAVFKPSEHTPLVGQAMAEAWDAAGVPPGVLNLVQGGPEAGQAIAAQRGIDGIYFTGSLAVGVSLRRALVERPGTILALEMGGNNPLIVHECADTAAAAYLTIQSAYLTAGQRCSCARRLIVPGGQPGDAFIQRLFEMIAGIRIGLPGDEPEPFMGPVISPRAASTLLDAQSRLANRGGRILAEMKPSPRSPALLSPGLIDVTNVSPREDEELFGPILQLIRVPDFDAAIAEANNTRYGLAAGLISDRRDLYDRFYRESRAGVVSWNRQLTGASSRLPFGGIGLSGNHRPSGYFAVDYCAYPVAALESERVALPAKPSPGITL